MLKVKFYKKFLIERKVSPFNPYINSLTYNMGSFLYLNEQSNNLRNKLVEFSHPENSSKSGCQINFNVFNKIV